MKHRSAILTVLALLSCTGTDVPHSPEPMPPPGPSDPLLRAQVERDLVLGLALTGPAFTEDSDPWPLAVTLTNRGAAAHSVVRASDGSDMGWREPHVFYTLDVQEPSGVYMPAQTQEVSRCGNYASAWMRDVMELAPGQSIAVEDYTPPSYSFDIERSARVRVVAHYAWEGGTKRSFDWKLQDDGAAPEPPLPHELGAVGPYELVSNPVELDVHVDRPIAIVLKLHNTRISRGSRAAAGFVTAWAESASTTNEDLGTDEIDHRFWLEGRLAAGKRTRMMIGLAGPTAIAPGQRAVLAVADAHDLDFDDAGRWELRIRYEALRVRTDGRTTVRRSRSPWVAVDVEP